MREDYERLIKLLYHGRTPEEIQEIQANMTDDFQVTEADDLPFGGIHAGKNALGELAKEVFATLGGVTLSYDNLMYGENCACSLVTLTPKKAPDQKIEIAEVFFFRDGKVCEIKPFYFNTQRVHDVATLIRG
jgi:hypothetical protein